MNDGAEDKERSAGKARCTALTRKGKGCKAPAWWWGRCRGHSAFHRRWWLRPRWLTVTVGALLLALKLVAVVADCVQVHEFARSLIGDRVVASASAPPFAPFHAQVVDVAELEAVIGHVGPALATSAATTTFTVVVVPLRGRGGYARKGLSALGVVSYIGAWRGKKRFPMTVTVLADADGERMLAGR